MTEKKEKEEKDKLKKFKSAKYIFTLGIGGSNLASKAVWIAMTMHKEKEKEVFFIESPDKRELEEVKINIAKTKKPSEIAFVVVSKSGETEETLDGFKKIFDISKNKFGEAVKNRFIIISTKGSELHKIAKDKKMLFLEWENNTGGRWSAFTVAHTTLLEITSLDAKSFEYTGKESLRKYEIDLSHQNHAKHLANEIFQNYNHGLNILEFFTFNEELEELGKWVRQLVAESLGKENKNKEQVGIVPTVSVGPQDLHSILELTLGGPKNKFTIFVISILETENSEIRKTYEATLSTYKKECLPFICYEFDIISEQEIAEFMAFMMKTVIFLAEMIGVNPYDQPAIEKYKTNLKNS